MKKGIALLLVATVLWAGNYISGRYLGPALPPTLLNTVRWAISSVILLAILGIQRKRLPLINMWKEFGLLGFTGIFAFSTLTYYALTNISASQAGMISAGIPIAILIFTPIFLKEKIGMQAWIGAFISIIGVMILFQGKMEAGFTSDSIVGNYQVVMAAIAWGIYTVLGKKYGAKTDPLILTAGASIYGTLFSGVSMVGSVDMNLVDLTPSVMLSIGYVSTLASVGAFLAWNIGVKIVGTGKAAPYLNMLPVWTVLLGIIVLDEEVSWLSWIGGFITISGAVLASLQRTSMPNSVATEGRLDRTQKREV